MNSEKDYVIIPNPLYDVVFRYLMEDYESAKIILSTLLGVKILNLEFEPHTHAEKVTDSATEKEIRLFHLDFNATIINEQGEEELVMIELQKAYIKSDIFRFKRYICKNFQKNDKLKMLIEKEDFLFACKFPSLYTRKVSIRGDWVFFISSCLIISKEAKGVFKGKIEDCPSEFVKHLNYDMYIVQLPNIQNIREEEYENDEYKSKLYKFLKLFDQQQAIDENRHRLRIFKLLFPKEFERLIKRLEAAEKENPDLEEQMHVEDEYLEELMQLHNDLAYLQEKLEKPNSGKQKQNGLQNKRE